ncbi:MAG: nucleoside-diphosphate kinase [Planctomycetota bacterium]
METTLVIIKPDGVQRQLVGRILTRFEEKGLQLVGMKMMKIPKTLSETHYSEHKGKPFYPGLIAYMTSSPVLVLALRGVRAIEVTRKLMGATFGHKAEPGTIRGDFAISGGFNLIHGSDSPSSAEKELKLFFKAEELLEYSLGNQNWIYEAEDLQKKA